MTQWPNKSRSQPPLALAVPLSRFTSRVGGGSAAMSKVKLKRASGGIFRLSWVNQCQASWLWLMMPARGASAKAGTADSEPYSSRQCRVTARGIPFNLNSNGFDFVRVFPAACRSFSRTVCYPFPDRQGYKEAKSVGRRQGNQARPFFLTVRKRTTEPIERAPFPKSHSWI